MIYWNPLYAVSFSEASIAFEDERGITELRHPPQLPSSWGLLRKLSSGIDKSNIDEASNSERQVLGLLLRRDLIVHVPSDPSASTIDQSLGHFLTFHSSPVAALEQLRNLHMCILGVGGVGAVVLQHFVALGIKNYTLVDCDVVEKSNLNRQLIYSVANIGTEKVAVAEEYVKSRLDNAKVNIFHKKVDSVEALDELGMPHCNFIVNCFDTPREKIDGIVHKCSEKRGVPVVGAGVGVYAGHWGPLLDPRSSPTYEEWKKTVLKGSSSSKSRKKCQPTRWSFGPTNTLIAVHLTRDVIEWLSGHSNVRSKDCRLVLDFVNDRLLTFGKTPGD
jgi:sulfur-carrier protein adenylyltransferase/sulfurtransferase